MTTLLWFATASGLLYGAHRTALWMERRGWIYYRNRHGSSGSLGAAFLEIQSIFEPSNRHVLEVQREENLEDEESPDPADGRRGRQTTAR